MSPSSAGGKIIRQGTLEEIGSGLAVDSEIRMRTRRPPDRGALSKLPGVSIVEVENGTVCLRVVDLAQAITHLVRYLDSETNQLIDISASRPTLEDVFLKLTGERLAGEEDQ